MKLYQGANLNELYVQALHDCVEIKSPTPSRVGVVYDLGPAVFELELGSLNILTLPKRALNPFFAIAESAWIIGGSNKLDTLSYYLKSYNRFSDDHLTLNGAYGFRLREHFGYDQINYVIKELRNTPESRRCVLCMYGPEDLTNKISKDIPCNTSIMLKIRDGCLDLTVTNRSNDIYLGVPYNFFVFQVLHYYLANEIGVNVGHQRHFTDSLHLYENNINEAREILNNIRCNSNELSCNPQEFIGMILRDIDNINSRRFSEIKSAPIREVMMMYESYTKKLDHSIFERDAGNPILNYLVKDWSSKYTTTNNKSSQS
ncbi:thymidylate synthase [Aeromonas caviae]|uniref:thymidylate synthase n=1 Tax=Aeromonas caviae TaxID=648 RepID=UPI002B46ACA9|nr:thymidylate synthase [Aeromonas caviae]